MKIGIFKHLLVFVLMVASGSALMVISHKVHIEEVRIARLDRSIAREKEAIRNLDAEWAYLNNPERLEKLASKYLDLVPPTNRDMQSDFSVLPSENTPAAQEESTSPVYQRDAAAHNRAQSSSVYITKASYSPSHGRRP